MAVIDFHTHAFVDALAPRALASLSGKSKRIPSYDGTLSGLRALMKEDGTDISVVHPVATKPTQVATINKWAAENKGDGICFFGAMHPLCDDVGKQLDFLKENGIKGIKLHPDYQSFFVDDEKIFPLYRAVFSRDMFILFHSGFDIGFPAPYHCTPERIIKLIKSFPDGKAIFAHTGCCKMASELATRMKEAFPDGIPHGYYADTSMATDYASDEDFKSICEVFGEDRIVYGTDSPWNKAETERATLDRRIAAVYGERKDEVKEKIYWKNAAGIIGL